MGKKRKQKKTQSVLSDHRREGKKFIPPLMDLPMQVDTYWRDVAMPELLWIGLLIQRHGLRQGTELSALLAKSAAKVWQDEKKLWFAKASNYNKLSDEQRRRVIEDASIADRKGEFQSAFYALNRWYPMSPVSFIGEAKTGTDLGPIKDLLTELYDRTGVVAMMTQTVAIYIGFVTHMLFIRPGMILGELQLIEEYPESEKSKMFGASVRASIGALIQGPEGSDRSWPNAFWQHGFHLEPCRSQEHSDG